MKKYITILAIVLFTSASYSQVAVDKQLHFGVTAITSMTTYNFIYQKTGNRNKAFLWSFVSSVVLGVAKELYDEIMYKGFDIEDLLYSSAGAFSGSFTFRVFTGKDNKKKQIKKRLF